jgi:hypothetical protein
MNSNTTQMKMVREAFNTPGLARTLSIRTASPALKNLVILQLLTRIAMNLFFQFSELANNVSYVTIQCPSIIGRADLTGCLRIIT